MDGYGGIDDLLEAALAAQAAVEGYITLRALKESELESTELVVAAEGSGGAAASTGAAASRGPAACGPGGSAAVAGALFVRKRIRLGGGTGSAYEVLFAAQRAGTPLPHAPRIEACARLGDELTVVMEYIGGPTLEEHVAERGAGPARARELMAPLCDAVSELHERLDPPLIHRDLKPSNIIISDGGGGRAVGEPVIIDFGIARAWRAGAEADTVRLGTRGYAAPEQFGFGQTDERSDVYALGMLLFFCCTGEQPRAGLDAAALAAAGVPDGLAAVILRATAFDPAARYQSAAAFKAALAAAESPSPRVGAPVRAAAAREPSAAGYDVGAAQEGWSGPINGPINGPASGSAPASSPLQRLSGALGRAWNAIVVMVWSFFMVILAMCVGDSLVGDGEYPLWYALCLFIGVGGAGISAVAWLIYDKRRLRRNYFEPWGLSRRHERLAFIALAAASALFFVFLLFVAAVKDALLS